MSGAALASSAFLRLLSQPQAVKRARDEVTAAARGWGLDGELLETLRLLISEIVTNTLHCARDQMIEVRATLKRDCVVLDVWDPASPIPKGDALWRMPDELTESGRGMPLVELLSSKWYERPLIGRSGKHLIAHVPFDSLNVTCSCAEEQ